jgi:hypothetical protein
MYTNLMAFLNFHRILAVENVKKYLVLALTIFGIAFLLYIANKKRVPTMDVLDCIDIR